MTRRLLIPLLVLLIGETAALACRCQTPPTNAKDRHALVVSVARGEPFALVRVRVAEPYDEATGRGELMQIRRILWGRARRDFEVYRDRPPASPSCDQNFRPGNHAWLLLYRPEIRALPPRYVISNRCLSAILDDDAFRLSLARRLRAGSLK